MTEYESEVKVWIREVYRDAARKAEMDLSGSCETCFAGKMPDTTADGLYPKCGFLGIEIELPKFRCNRFALRE